MDSHKIDTELVSNVIANLKRGKAIDIDGLYAEHLQYIHPSLCVVLSIDVKNVFYVFIQGTFFTFLTFFILSTFLFLKTFIENTI